MRKCSALSCGGNVFGTDKNTGKGYCRFHQYMRTDTKKKIRKKSLKEKNWKLARNKQGFDPFQWGYSNEYELFMSLWKKEGNISAISGRELDSLYESPQWVNCFAHVLCKKNFPLYRYNPGNILVVHPYEHWLVDQGTVAQRMDYILDFPESDFNVFYGLQKPLKEGYKIVQNGV